MQIKKEQLNPFFSHIYIEKEALSYQITKKILSFFPFSTIINITHYKDIFGRNNQNYQLQKQTPSLILAVKKEHLIYKGAPVCQDFGNSYFYYTSCIMNCIYDCEYCYLQGMYPSAYLVVFVNLEDIFKAVQQLLVKHPVYLCVSYDTDLLALESILGYTKKWIDFVHTQKNLTIEIRTKSANWSYIEDILPTNSVILAWTLSPTQMIKRFECRAPSLEARLFQIKQAINKGYQIRLCFDPILYEENWEILYNELIQTAFSYLEVEKIKDVSIGVFRISHDYLKRMRKQNPSSLLLHYPFQNDNGVFHYGKILSKTMITYISHLITQYIPNKKIFIWEENMIEEKNK